MIPSGAKIKHRRWVNVLPVLVVILRMVALMPFPSLQAISATTSGAIFDTQLINHHIDDDDDDDYGDVYKNNYFTDTTDTAEVGNGSRTASATQRFRSFKMAEYYDKLNVLLSRITESSSFKGDSSWISASEGSTFKFPKKIEVLQTFAADPRVEHICEIGFNFGGSTLNFLVSNPYATVTSFDIFRHKYSGAAVSVLQDMFPNRTINVLGGDSATAVENLARLLQVRGVGGGDGFKCNLILIDGGHTVYSFLRDLDNMKLLADPAFNRFIIDDFDHEQINDAYYNYLQLNNHHSERVLANRKQHQQQQQQQEQQKQQGELKELEQLVMEVVEYSDDDAEPSTTKYFTTKAPHVSIRTLKLESNIKFKNCIAYDPVGRDESTGLEYFYFSYDPAHCYGDDLDRQSPYEVQLVKSYTNCSFMTGTYVFNK